MAVALLAAVVACGATTPPMLEPLSPEEQVLRRVLVEARRSSTAALASATLSHPTALAVVGQRVFASEFRRDRVVVASTGSGRWRVFADRGPHCARDPTTGVVDCAILDGPWGLASVDGLLFVASFGSDQILAFNETTADFRFVLGGPLVLDSPEGLAVGPDGRLLVASFLDSRLVAFDAEGTPTTLARGVPIEVDFEAAAFKPRAWGSAALDAGVEDSLRGPEHVAASGDSIFVASLHNDTLLEFQGGAVKRIYDLPDGPLGLVVVPAKAATPFRDALGAPPARAPLVLVATYRGDQILALDLVDDTIAPLPLVDKRLLGPAALALDPRHPTVLYVACYDSGAVLFFDMASIPSPLATAAASIPETKQNATTTTGPRSKGGLPPRRPKRRRSNPAV